MDRSKWLSAQQAIQSLSKKSNKEFLDKFLSLKDDVHLIELPKDQRQQYIEEKIDEQFDALNEINVKAKCNLGELKWLDDRKESLVVQLNNRRQLMGRCEEGKIYLNNEETLFLVESNSAICFHKSLQLSLQDSFSLMISSELEFERYIVYGYLMRFGFRVRRASSCDASSWPDDQLLNVKEDSGSNKRSLDMSNCEEVKRLKKKEFDDERSTESFQNRILPLRELVQDLHLINVDSSQMDFMKFIRFKKLSKSCPSSWDELIEEHRTSNNLRPAFVVENSDKMDNLDDDKFRQLCEDFINDSPLIKLNESLTNSEIQHRLAQHAPQLDTSNDLINTSDTYDYDVYLPNRKIKIIKNTQPDYFLKIIHSFQSLNFPIEQIFKLNTKVPNREKLLFALCQSHEFNFYQFSDVDLVNY